MDIRPVPFDQVALGKDGRTYAITGEAGRIAAALAEIDGVKLSACFNEGGMYFEVLQEVQDPRPGAGARKVPVMRVPMEDWDGRVVDEMRMRAFEVRHGISAADRLDADDRAADRARERRLEEEVGEACYSLFRAFQRDLGTNPRIFVPARDRAPVAEAA